MQGAATQAMWLHCRGAATQQMPVRRRAPKGCWLSGLQHPMPSLSKIRKPESQQQNVKSFLREPLLLAEREQRQSSWILAKCFFEYFNYVFEVPHDLAGYPL